MGIYIYTLRAATKKLGGLASPVEIGQFKFAYKAFWGAKDDKVCASQLAAGRRAADKLAARNVQLFVKGEWHDGQSVHYNHQAFGSLTEEFTSCPHVGWLTKTSNGSWCYVAKDHDQLLREFPEIGILNGEDGEPLYYFTDRDRDGKERSFQYKPNANLYQVVQNVSRMRRRINGY